VIPNTFVQIEFFFMHEANPMEISNPDAEQALENRTMQLFTELGWRTANAYYEAFVPDEATTRRPYLGRTEDTQVLLRARLRECLDAFNPDLPPVAIDAAMTKLTQGRSMTTLIRANHKIYHLLKNGVQVQYRDAEGHERFAQVQVINWERSETNDFLMVQQFWVQGELYRRRPDLIGFVNGIPLLFGELKAHHRKLENAYDDNLSDYKDTIPPIFWYTGLVVLSNGSQSAVGNMDAEFRHFSTWKRVADESEQGRIALETTARGVCTPQRLLDLIENYTLYQKRGDGLQKITAKNHQYLGVENVLEALHQLHENPGKLGVFWHTQGSGKSFSMVFFTQKVLRRVGGNFTFVIVTDRKDLDDQIYKTFARCGVVTEGENQVRAQSGEHLKQLLMEDHRYVFTLIQKFHTRDGGAYPVLSERKDVIVITDEAHRTQYDVLAMNMRRALPNAAFIGFTGTPLMANEEELTRQVFGDYVSIYDFKQSIDDGATVPLYYENRIPELQITNAELNAQMADVLENADVDEEAEEALAHRFVREYELITREERLETVAEDIVDHFVNRGYRGKGMVVSVDKLTTVKMYEKVQKYWQRKLEALRQELATAPPEARPALEDKIHYMETTDMAVVLSQGQGEVAEFRRHDLDILPHRERIVNEDLDEKFKDPDDPFRLVFVCAMWRTGFDAPACSTIYLDRPMRNHTLMQTIARANRVFGEKNNGLIIDYIGIFRELQKALAIYATGRDGTEGDYPIEDKAALVAELCEAVEAVETFCEERGVEIEPILETTDAFDRIVLMDAAINSLVDAETQEALDDAVEQILVNDDLKTRFFNLVAAVDRLFKAVLPDTRASEFAARRKLFVTLVDKIQVLTSSSDLPDVDREVRAVLDETIQPRPYVIRETGPLYDLSKIDFDELRERFETGRKRTEAERLRGKVNAKLQRMVRRNRTRIDYRERFQQLIDAYNEGAANVEAYFERLVEFTEQLREEEQRHIRENLSEEELAVFDILTRPDPGLTEEEKREVKQVARELLQTLKSEKLVLDWKKRQQYRARVRIAIEDMLYEDLPQQYSEALCDQKRDDVYRHIYDNYESAEQSVYAAA